MEIQIFKRSKAGAGLEIDKAKLLKNQRIETKLKAKKNRFQTHKNHLEANR